MTHTTSKQELFVTLVTTVNYCHKEIYYRYYKGVLDSPLKLATIKSLKMRNCKVMLKATKIQRNNFPGGQFSGGQFSWGHFSEGLFSGGQFSKGAYFQGEIFRRAIFSGVFFRGLFSRGHFSGHLKKNANIMKPYFPIKL